jgi:phenylpyruvate tautomerase PptA (4-oxalocrotonate tautomerase family)
MRHCEKKTAGNNRRQLSNQFKQAIVLTITQVTLTVALNALAAAALA